MKKIYLIILIIIIIFFVVLIYNKPLNQEEIISEDKTQDIEIPMEKAGERITKKPFGIEISPENSPISPERFSGYHTGVDYEIFEIEENLDVQIFAICDGKLLKKETATGYGGIAIQECELNNQIVTILYGHIKISSIQQNIGDYISKGKKLAVLGTGFSQETDNERKHLHLGIHKGLGIDVRGYVETLLQLEDWIDFEEYLSNKK